MVKLVVNKEGVIGPINHTLQTLRYKLFVGPTRTTNERRKSILTARGPA